MMPQPLRAGPEDDGRVRMVYAICHPDAPPRPTQWYVAYPTLVLRHEHEIIGFTSCSISPALTGILTLYGNDLCVLPVWQKRGLGWQLAQARHALGRAVGATQFVGIARPSNAPMCRIFERQGLHACQALPRYFGDEDGLAWIGTLT